MRHGLTEVVTAGGVPRRDGWPQDVVGRLELVTTELGANALRHAQGPVAVEVARTDGGWLVRASDGRPHVPPHLPDPRPPGHGGHGLEVVRRLSVEVGWYVDGAAKHVWAVVRDDTTTLPLDGDAPAPPPDGADPA
ncbi:ATP-binding protein [Thalassiella azotivora]